MFAYRWILLLTKKRNPSLRWHKSAIRFGWSKKKTNQRWSCAKCYLLTYYTISSLTVGDEFRSIAPNKITTALHICEWMRTGIDMWVCVSIGQLYDHQMLWGVNKCTELIPIAPKIKSKRIKQNKAQKLFTTYASNSE